MKNPMAAQVLWIYKTLLRRFGPQGWWPVTPKGRFKPVYSTARRALSPNEKFEIAVGAVLTQNTAWRNVEKALAGLHRARAVAPSRLAALPSARLQNLIRPSGYFRQKSKRLQAFSRYFLRRWNGRLDRFLKQPAARAREELLALNGVGPETADSILLYAGEHPLFVVDAYTRRLGERFGLFKNLDYDGVQRFFEARLEKSAALFREFHALIVAVGKEFCRPKPRCGTCPLNARCVTAS